MLQQCPNQCCKWRSNRIYTIATSTRFWGQKVENFCRRSRRYIDIVLSGLARVLSLASPLCCVSFGAVTVVNNSSPSPQQRRQTRNLNFGPVLALSCASSSPVVFCLSPFLLFGCFLSACFLFVFVFLLVFAGCFLCLLFCRLLLLFCCVCFPRIYSLSILSMLCFMFLSRC